MLHISSAVESTVFTLSCYKCFLLIYSAHLKTLKELVKAFRNDLVRYKYSLIDSCQQELSTRILLCSNQSQLVF